MGFYVMLKPHVCMTDKSDNRNINNTPTEAFAPEAFFPDWTAYLLDMAAVADYGGEAAPGGAMLPPSTSSSGNILCSEGAAGSSMWRRSISMAAEPMSASGCL